MAIYKNRSNIWEALGMLLACRSGGCYYYHFFFSFLVGMNRLFPALPKEAAAPGPRPRVSASFPEISPASNVVLCKVHDRSR